MISETTFRVDIAKICYYKHSLLFYIEMKTAWKVILVLLYYKQLFATPIISDNALPILTENNFQTCPPPSLPLFLDPVYWYLGYLELESIDDLYLLNKKDSQGFKGFKGFIRKVKEYQNLPTIKHLISIHQ